MTPDVNQSVSVDTNQTITPNAESVSVDTNQTVPYTKHKPVIHETNQTVNPITTPAEKKGKAFLGPSLTQAGWEYAANLTGMHSIYKDFSGRNQTSQDRINVYILDKLNNDIPVIANIGVTGPDGVYYSTHYVVIYEPIKDKDNNIVDFKIKDSGRDHSDTRNKGKLFHDYGPAFGMSGVTVLNIHTFEKNET